MSEAGRLAGVFFEPGKTFAEIGRRPRWLVPLLLVVLASLAFTVTASRHVGWERVVRKSIESNPRTQSLSTEQKELAIQRGAQFAPIFGYAAPIVGAPITIALMAAVLLLTSRLFGADVNYKQLFAINSYASLTGVVFVVLGIVVMFLKPPDDFDIQNPLAFNVGAFLDPQSTSKALYSLATSIDLFTFWRMALLAVGISAAAKRFPIGKACAAVLLPWLLLVLAKAGIAARF